MNSPGSRIRESSGPGKPRVAKGDVEQVRDGFLHKLSGLQPISSVPREAEITTPLAYRQPQPLHFTAMQRLSLIGVWLAIAGSVMLPQSGFADAAGNGRAGYDSPEPKSGESAVPAGVGQGQEKDLTQIKERELELVREKISALKRSMDRRAADRDRITGELQRVEVQVSEKRIRLNEIRRQRKFSERRKQAFDAELKLQEAALGEETALLAAQIQSAYISGRQERIKLLLNQNEPQGLGRLMTYYRYFSEYRARNIRAVTASIENLDRLGQQSAAEENRLAGLARSRYAELTELNSAQQGRRRLLVALRTRIAEQGTEVRRLAAQERDLSRLITELRSILSDYPISSEEPFSRLKGRLTWPVAGRLSHDFGQPRAGGGLKWHGVVLSAPRGREVRAVYHGRVVFADWLAGMGLLVIVDHGEGYMSLYGYNETTLKSTGDWVAPGDVIATVGESGGQPQPALYFELRKGTKPINPDGWFRRQPQTG